eukprot:TRINITY_DN67437_c0_g1_i1.p1 TRINITY_DN67437_c0_g1~~TRINITY_DN67437_c0_g1_i1.p1  ORF type:complete len:173 (-),score=27.70 TRINITY_DN67437_c0_g1_i1:89-583(-)
MVRAVRRKLARVSLVAGLVLAAWHCTVSGPSQTFLGWYYTASSSAAQQPHGVLDVRMPCRHLAGITRQRHSALFAMRLRPKTLDRHAVPDGKDSEEARYGSVDVPLPILAGSLLLVAAIPVVFGNNEVGLVLLLFIGWAGSSYGYVIGREDKVKDKVSEFLNKK